VTCFGDADPDQYSQHRVDFRLKFRVRHPVLADEESFEEVAKCGDQEPCHKRTDPLPTRQGLQTKNHLRKLVPETQSEQMSAR